MGRRVWNLIIKEILTLVRDKQGRRVLIIPPLLQLFVFAFAATLDVKNIPIAILNRDSGQPAYELTQRFHGARVFSHITYLQGIEQIAPFIDEQYGVMVLSINASFSRELLSKQPASVQLILDGRKSNTAQIVAGYAQSILEQFGNDFSAQHHLPMQNTILVNRNWFNPNLLYYWFNVPSLCAILTMLVSLIITALSIAREREMGTFDQLLVSPLQPIEILLGKTLPALFIGLIEATVIITVGVYIFQIPFAGSLAALYFSLAVFISAIVGVGLFISSLCSTQQQAVLGTFVFMSPAVLLSGYATPIENMPTWLQPITYINPLRYMLIIARGIFLKDMPWDMVWNNTWPMALIAFVNLSGATWFFRRRLE
jgi:ABC-2 type transport system permease protein